MAYKSVPEGCDLSIKFPTWIIAYCPDTDIWFCTNNRFSTISILMSFSVRMTQ